MPRADAEASAATRERRSRWETGSSCKAEQEVGFSPPGLPQAGVRSAGTALSRIPGKGRPGQIMGYARSASNHSANSTTLI